MLIPDAGELAVVAPVNAQVSLVTLQLSFVVALGVVTLAVQLAADVFAVILPGHTTVGAIGSVTVTL